MEESTTSIRFATLLSLFHSLRSLLSLPQNNVPLEAYRKGLDAAFYACAGFAFFAALVAAVGLVGIGKVGHKAVKAPPRAAVDGEGVRVGEKGEV